MQPAQYRTRTGQQYFYDGYQGIKCPDGQYRTAFKTRGPIVVVVAVVVFHFLLGVQLIRPINLNR